MPKTLRITAFVLATIVLVWLLLTLVRTQLPVTVIIENGGLTAIQSVQVVHERLPPF
jgi:hypothetical protein